MELPALALSAIIILVLLIAYISNTKYFYYVTIIAYPIIGQTYKFNVTVFGFNLNPSMLFGFMVFFILIFDSVIKRSLDKVLDLYITIFLLYGFFTTISSPDIYYSMTWTIKIGTWLLILTNSIKTFSSSEDINKIAFSIKISAVIVIASFFASKAGLYGKGFVYETGAISYGAGFSSGKIVGYYLTVLIPIYFAGAIKTDKMMMPFIFTFFSVLIIVLTYVRAPIIGLLIMVIAYLFYSYKYKIFGITKAGIYLAVALILIIVVSQYFFHAALTDRWKVMAQNVEEHKIEKVGSGRLGGIMAFTDFFLQRETVFQKLFGLGMGSSKVIFGTGRVLHNDYAEIIMGYGLFGFLLYIIILFRLHRIQINLIKRGDIFHKKMSLFSLMNYYVFLIFNFTSVTSGVIILSVWAIHIGSSIGYGKKYISLKDKES